MIEVKPLLFLVGPQPPPRHGVSAVNEALFKLAHAAGLSPLCLNTAPASLDRSFIVRLTRFLRVWQSATRLSSYVMRNSCNVYISLSGGLGLVWEAMFAWQASHAEARLIVHHHSFRYLDQDYWPMRLLVRAAGRKALHVVLCRGMEAALRRRYPRIRNTLVLSNSALVKTRETHDISRATDSAEVMGLLANLSEAKGLDDFVALVEASYRRGLLWRFILAGPFESKIYGKRMMSRIKALPNLDYRGSLYGADKSAFFEEIDAFIFPTRYLHEAEPLVVLEAMSRGRPVIAYGRGCISDMLEHSGGCVILPGTDFVGQALEVLEAWRKEGSDFRFRRESALRRFHELRKQGAQSLQQLLKILGTPNS